MAATRINKNRDDFEYEQKLKSGKISLPPISPELRLDSYFNRNSNLDQVFGLKELSEVEDLSMRDNCLFKLPDNLAENLLNLKKINLSYNNLEKLNRCFRSLINLEELIVDKNRLIELPEYLGDLVNLRIVKAMGNKLVKIPESLENLVNLEELDFSYNAIRDIPESWERLVNLKIVNLSYNELKSLPKCIVEGSPRLQILDLSNNLISGFRDLPLSSDMRKLYLNNNIKNEQFPSWLFSQKFEKLEELILDETVFKSFEIPEQNFVHLKLKKLSMVQCGLSDRDFEKISRSMTGLKYLNVSNEISNQKANVFWVMPARDFVNPEELEELNIKGVGLPSVPQEVNRLGNLLRLNISQNNVSSLPEEISELKRLEFLNAARNKLYALPQSIGNLKALKILFLEANNLSGLPDSMQNLEHLEYLDLYKNEFLEIPAQLEKIPNLKALDIDGNDFKTDNLQIANIKYQKAKDILRYTSNLLLLRSDIPKILEEADHESLNSLAEYEEDRCNVDNKSLIDTNLSDIVSEENWGSSEDSADDFDPTVKPKKNYLVHSPFTVSSVFYYGNFCPADLHSARIKDQLAAMQQQTSSNVIEGQFDDA